MSDQTRQVIVLESRPFWEPELKRQFLKDDVRVGACRSVKDLDQRLACQVYDVCVIDLSADLAGLLRWLSDQQDRGSHVTTLVIATDEQEPLEWHVRELGATVFTNEYVTGHQLAAKCRKLWNKQ